MKKIFILPILIAPIIAMADDPIGPAHVNSGAVVATDSAPYATATEQTGDSTTVVSASYVKGAYNDAIAAVNKVASNLDILDDYVNSNIEDEIASKQAKLTNSETDDAISPTVMSKDYVSSAGVIDGDDDEFEAWYDDVDQTVGGADNTLMSAAGIMTLVRTAATKTNSKRISAVTTWGDDTHPTQLRLTTASN